MRPASHVSFADHGPDCLERTTGGWAEAAGALANGVVNPNEKEPMTDEFSAQFQRELVSNVAVRVTGVYSRWVCVMGGVIMLVLGLIPKLAFIVASVPQCVLGGAGFIMFGMVAATGIKILSTVDYAGQRNNVLVVAIAIGFGLIPIVSPNFFRVFPDVLKPIFGDGIILTSIAAVLFNAFFNRTSSEQAEADTLLAAQAAEHI